MTDSAEDIRPPFAFGNKNLTLDLTNKHAHMNLTHPHVQNQLLKRLSCAFCFDMSFSVINISPPCDRALLRKNKSAASRPLAVPLSPYVARAAA